MSQGIYVARNLHSHIVETFCSCSSLRWIACLNNTKIFSKMYEYIQLKYITFENHTGGKSIRVYNLDVR